MKREGSVLLQEANFIDSCYSRVNFNFVSREVKFSFNFTIWYFVRKSNTSTNHTNLGIRSFQLDRTMYDIYKSHFSFSHGGHSKQSKANVLFEVLKRGIQEERTYKRKFNLKK